MESGLRGGETEIFIVELLDYESYFCVDVLYPSILMVIV